MNIDKLIEKYYKKNSETYFVLTKHSKQVRDKALEIIYKHPELNIDKKFVAEAAMLHDIGIFKCNAPRIHCHGVHQYIEHGYLGADIVRSEGFDRHALVCERHTGTGLSLEMIERNRLPLPHRNMLPETIEEQLICYADKFYSKTQLGEEHELVRIRTYLERFGKEELNRFDNWHILFR